ncbi:MAG: hypothetical protein ACRDWW_05765, partial [Acidimicrobiales bacterium]
IPAGAVGWDASFTANCSGAAGGLNDRFAARFEVTGEPVPPQQGANPPTDLVGIAANSGGTGYWQVAADGTVYNFDLPFDGSMGGHALNAPVVGIAATPDDGGYWLVAADGGVFTFGDAGFYGSMGGKHLNAPVSGIGATYDSNGYWLVAEDGGVFTFGDATFYGSGASPGPTPANSVNAFARTDLGSGYWLSAANGAILSFGGAPWFGAQFEG